MNAPTAQLILKDVPRNVSQDPAAPRDGSTAGFETRSKRFASDAYRDAGAAPHRLYATAPAMNTTRASNWVCGVESQLHGRGLVAGESAVRAVAGHRLIGVGVFTRARASSGIWPACRPSG